MLDDSFHQRYCFSEEDQQLFKEKAVALAHLFLHLPSHHIIRLGGGKCALNENSFGSVLSSALERSGFVWYESMPTSAWRGARERAWGILCPSCWQGIPLQSWKGSSSQTSRVSAGKLARGSLSLIWEAVGDSVPCNMSIITKVITEQDPGCFGTRHWLPLTGAILLLPLLLLAPSLSLSNQRLVRVIREILCMFRCPSEQVPGWYCPCSHRWAPEKLQSAGLPNSKHRKAWKNITPPSLEADSKGKAQKRKHNCWVLVSATEVLGQFWHTDGIYHIFSLSLLFLGTLADDLNICISQVSVYNFITKGFVSWYPLL